ncbi:MAG: IclR family transcriptional regulator [Candidatus Limnocylindrales bacterium]
MKSTGAARSTSFAPRQPIAKAVGLISWMIDAPGHAWGVRDLARGTGLAPTTVHRLLAALIEVDFVSFDRESERYSLGVEFLRLTLKNSSKLGVARVANAHLVALSRAFDETAFLSIYDARRREAMFASAVESTNPLRFVVRLYEWLPVRQGASGLAILAFLSAGERDAILQSTDGERGSAARDDIERELSLIREDGYARTEGQRVPGAVGLAAPIFSAANQVVGDVGLSIPSQRYGGHDESALVAAVIGCARNVSRDLGAFLSPRPTRGDRNPVDGNPDGATPATRKGTGEGDRPLLVGGK